MRKFRISSETRTLAEVRFHGENTDAPGEAVITQGTEETLEVILDVLRHALTVSKVMTRSEAPPPATLPATPSPSAPAEGGERPHEIVSDLSAFRARKNRNKS